MTGVSKRKAIAFTTLIIALVAGCATSKGGITPRTSCTPDARLIGTWRSYRLSGLGPSWMTLTLNDDCTARIAVQMLFMRYTEQSSYRVERDALVFTREHGTTRWPYSVVSGKLLLQEASDEQHEYVRAGQRTPTKHDQ